MKTLAELKEMGFVPHHNCGVCGSMVGWVVSKDALKPYFDPSCDCGSSAGHYDTWESVFKWYNTVDEKETEEAVRAAWDNEAMAIPSEKLTHQCVRSEAEDIRSEVECFRQEVNSQLNTLQDLIGNFAEKGCVDFIRQRLDRLEWKFSAFSECKPICEMLENHKSNWIADSKGGEPNCRR